MEAKTLEAQLYSYTTFNPMKLPHNRDSIAVNLAPYHNIRIWVTFHFFYRLYAWSQNVISLSSMIKTTDLHTYKLFHKYTILT